MKLWANLNETELNHMIGYYRSLKGLRQLILKDNAFDIMLKLFPDDFNDDDKAFFDKYKNKLVWVYHLSNTITNKIVKQDNWFDWFILEDDNYCLDFSCFKEPEKEQL